MWGKIKTKTSTSISKHECCLPVHFSCPKSYIQAYTHWFCILAWFCRNGRLHWRTCQTRFRAHLQQLNLQPCSNSMLCSPRERKPRSTACFSFCMRSVKRESSARILGWWSSRMGPLKVSKYKFQTKAQVSKYNSSVAKYNHGVSKYEFQNTTVQFQNTTVEFQNTTV